MIKQIIAGFITAFSLLTVSCSDITAPTEPETTKANRSAVEMYLSGISYESITLDRYDLNIDMYKTVLSILPDTIGSLEYLDSLTATETYKNRSAD